MPRTTFRWLLKVFKKENSQLLWATCADAPSAAQYSCIPYELHLSHKIFPILCVIRYPQIVIKNPHAGTFCDILEPASWLLAQDPVQGFYRFSSLYKCHSQMLFPSGTSRKVPMVTQTFCLQKPSIVTPIVTLILHCNLLHSTSQCHQMPCKFMIATHKMISNCQNCRTYPVLSFFSHVRNSTRQSITNYTFNTIIGWKVQ